MLPQQPLKIDRNEISIIITHKDRVTFVIHALERFEQLNTSNKYSFESLIRFDALRHEQNNGFM